MDGESVYSTKNSSKKEDVIEFLGEIKDKNEGKRIVIIPDNFSAHRSFETRKAIKNLNIELVFLPPYSPDLNPIEFIWKSIKRELSSIFLMCKEEIKRVIEVLFYAFSSSLSS